MATVEFFLHHRRDGGERTGFAVNGTLVRQQFDDRWDDPTLVWFVELTAHGADVPDDPDDANHWFSHHVPEFRPLLKEAADMLDGDADYETWPVRLKGEVGGTRLELRVYAAHGFGPRALSAEILALARDLGSTVRSLPPFDEAEYEARRDAWFSGLAA